MMDFEGPTKKRPMRIGTVETIDVPTGEVIDLRHNAMSLQPPPDGVCPECGADHEYDQPHNQQSLYYQYHFCATHGRWPTWTDAMAHCPAAVRDAWRLHLIAEMRRHGLPIPEDLLAPGAGGGGR